MRRREFLALAAPLLSAAPGGRPNIVLIAADEFGIGGVSCYGADHFRTPNLDRLASGGARFTHSYTSPLSGPSRALILTGRYAFRTGAMNQDASDQLDPASERLLPQLLQDAGYATAHVGPWSLAANPAACGFTESLKLQPKGAAADRMHDFLVDFISQRQSQPFFALYSLSQLHGAIVPTPDTQPQDRDLYARNIEYLDKMVGKLIAHLERMKLRDNTLVIFTSTSGTGGVYAGESTVHGRRLAGEKGSMQEGGSLVPTIANWPGVIAPGQVWGDLIDSTDFLPTFAELAGAPVPQVDGRSFASLLHGRQGKAREWVYVQLGAQWYVRDASSKLNQAGQFFDMTGAPWAEQEVTVDRNPEAYQRLHSALGELNPAGGIQDSGDGSGRHATHTIHTKKRRQP